MNQINPRLLSILKAWDPEVREEELVDVINTNLHLLHTREKVKSILSVSKSYLTVYTDEKVTHRIPTESLESIKLNSGVGCVTLEYRCHGQDEPVLIGRADNRYLTQLNRWAKRINHYIRYRNTDFSRISAGEETICPKCGKPFPKGSHVCPRCVSKKQTFTRLFSLLKGEWLAVFIAMVFFFLVAGVEVLTPMINRVLVDDYIQQTQENVRLWGFLGVIFAMLLAHVARRIFGVGQRFFLIKPGDRLVRKLRDTVFSKIQELSIEKISKRTSGELLRRVNTDTDIIKQFLINQLPTLFNQLIMLVGVCLILFLYDPLLAILILLPAPFVALSFRLFWRFIRNLYHHYWDLNSRSGAVLHDIFSGIRVVKAYGTEEKEEKRFTDVSQQEMESQMRAERFWAFVNPWLHFFMGLGEYVLLYYVGTKMLAGQMTAGEMSQFSSYATLIYSPLNFLMSFPRQLMRTTTSLTRVYEIIDETVDIKSEKELRPAHINGYIQIDDISFGYEDGDTVLHNVSLKIEPGEFIGLVGKSGVGKSTLINLIMRMYDVEEGSIRIDGIDLRDLSQETLRSRMGVVLQETFLFAGSIWQNLTYAKPDATREEVINAAKAAGAHEFIVNLPDGYNTYVGEKGQKLSGGERQRIAIARALLHDPRILILDEATSALDTETEKLIQDALQVLSRGRTTIAIAHRLSTLRNATRLVVLDQGTVAEEGTHEELMAKEGIYYGLLMAQREMTKIDV